MGLQSKKKDRKANEQAVEPGLTRKWALENSRGTTSER
jgi:hypothetical protein